MHRGPTQHWVTRRVPRFSEATAGHRLSPCRSYCYVYAIRLPKFNSMWYTYLARMPTRFWNASRPVVNHAPTSDRQSANLHETNIRGPAVRYAGGGCEHAILIPMRAQRVSLLHVFRFISIEILIQIQIQLQATSCTWRTSWTHQSKAHVCQRSSRCKVERKPEL